MNARPGLGLESVAAKASFSVIAECVAAMPLRPEWMAFAVRVRNAVPVVCSRAMPVFAVLMDL